MGLLVPWVLEYPGWYPDPRETATVYTKFPCSSEASQTFHVTIFFNKVWGCGLLWLLKLWSEFSNQSWQDDPTIKSVHSSSPMTGVRTLGPVVVKDRAYTAVLWLPQVCPSIHPLSHTHHTNIRKIKTNEDFLLGNSSKWRTKMTWHNIWHMKAPRKCHSCNYCRCHHYHPPTSSHFITINHHHHGHPLPAIMNHYNHQLLSSTTIIILNHHYYYHYQPTPLTITIINHNKHQPSPSSTAIIPKHYHHR